MKVSIVTFANLGKKLNLKSPDILPVIEAFAKTNELQQVLCQITKDFSFPNTSSVVPLPVRGIIRLYERIFRTSFSREAVESLFDLFATQKLRSADLVLFHPGYFMARAIQKVRRCGAVTVDLAVSAHVAVNAQLEREEMVALGFESFDGLYTTLDKKYSTGVVSECDYVLAMSEFVKDSYIQAGFPQEKIFVASPDIDTERFSPNMSADSAGMQASPFSILYMAYTQPLKGLHYLLDAWKACELSDAHLTIVGGFPAMPDSLRTRYREQIEADPRIVWVPDTQEPEKFYREASVLVFPSLTEGFGRVTLEAMACGLPVITTEHAKGIVEEGKTGCIVPIRDAQALRNKIEFLYHNPMQRVAMGKAAREAVLHKEPFGKKVYEICQEIMAKEAMPRKASAPKTTV